MLAIMYVAWLEIKFVYRPVGCDLYAVKPIYG